MKGSRSVQTTAKQTVKKAAATAKKAAVPEAKGALDRFKMEVAGELGVPLTDVTGSVEL